MSIVSPPYDQVQFLLTTPTSGVIGLVDGLLTVAANHTLRLEQRGPNCQVTIDNGEEQLIPLRKSVMRAALARIAVLCNEHKAGSVSPYDGFGEFAVGPPARLFRAEFVNSPEEQVVALSLISPVGENGPAQGPPRPLPVSEPTWPR